MKHGDKVAELYACPNGCEGAIRPHSNPKRLLIDCPNCNWFWEYRYEVEKRSKSKKVPKRKKKR